jgi:putative ABC transport system permease protein
MTVIGISGCTALLLTGFGIRDSVSSIMSLQFEQITLYDMTIGFSDSARQQDISRVEDLLQSNASSQGFITLRAKLKDAINPEVNLTPRQFTLIVTEDTDNLSRFIVLRDRTTGETIPAPSDGVVITEKLSDLLSLGIGDQILLKDGNESAVTATVTGITENYVFHYVYMNSELYEQLYGDPPEYNTIYALLNNDGTSALAREILEKRSVNTITFTQNQINNMNDVLSSLNFVMLILILSAGALAFVVLMNLSSINISERMRELATLEVLGFNDKEIFSYIFRENTVLTIVGAFVGLGFGMLLHLYVLLSAETEIMMFGRNIHPMSYIYSIALTVVFSIIANVFSSRKLKRIQMVEALKSAE